MRSGYFQQGSKATAAYNDDGDNNNDESGNDANYIISYKALNIDAAYVRSIRDAGYPDISKKQHHRHEIAGYNR